MSKKILIVDDDNLARKSLNITLAEAGFTVLEAEDGAKGLATALAEHPDIILTDVHMPEKDGLEMVSDLRQDAWGKTVPVIILSTDEETTTLNHALEAGVTIYLSKNNTSPDDIATQISQSLQ